MSSRIYLALALSVAVACSAFAHNGQTFVMPTFPDPTAFVLDGEEDDWGWLDTDTFAFLPEDIEGSIQQEPTEHFGQGPNPDPEDFTATVFFAWSPPPDNALYVFARAQDDTLRSLEDKPDWWNDDILLLNLDFDHSGGEWLSDPTDGYRLVMTPIGSKTEGVQVQYDHPGDEWGGFPPYTWITTTVLPPGATHFSSDVEYTYEVRHHPMDIYDVDGFGQSDPHIFEAEEVVHLSFRFDDGDKIEHGEQDLWGPVGAGHKCDQSGPDCPDFIMVPTDMADPYISWEEGGAVPTAVKASTWGRIKNHIRYY